MCYTCGLSVASSAKTVRLTSRREQNVPQQFLYCSAASWMLKDQWSKSRMEKWQNCFVHNPAAHSPITSSEHRDVPWKHFGCPAACSRFNSQSSSQWCKNTKVILAVAPSPKVPRYSPGGWKVKDQCHRCENVKTISGDNSATCRPIYFKYKPQCCKVGRLVFNGTFSTTRLHHITP